MFVTSRLKVFQFLRADGKKELVNTAVRETGIAKSLLF